MMQTGFCARSRARSARRDDDRRGAVGLEAAVEQPIRVGDHRRREVVGHRHRPAVHHRGGIALRVLAHRDRDRAELLGPRAELVHVSAREQRVPLRRRA